VGGCYLKAATTSQTAASSTVASCNHQNLSLISLAN